MNSDFTLNLNNLTEDEKKEFAKLFEKVTMKEKQRIAWKPKKGDEYFTISDFGIAQSNQWYDDVADNEAYDIGNVYETSKDAEFAIEKKKVKEELERYAFEHNDSNYEEWDGCIIWHYFIQLFVEHKELEIGNTCTRKVESVTYFTSEEIAKDAIKAVGEDRIKKYLFNIEVE